MMKTIKVMLCPNQKQRTKLFACAGLARFAYNWALDREQESHKAGNPFRSDSYLRKQFTALKSEKDYQWLSGYSNNIPKQAIKDAVRAYQKFFKGRSKVPKFKSKRKSRPSFYVDPYKIRFTATHVKLEKLTTSRKKNKQRFSLVKLSESNRIPVNATYLNPRVTFDGLNWWISVGVEYDPDEESKDPATGPGIGIDLGIKELAVCSDQVRYGNINKTKTVRKQKKRIRRLQRKISRKYLKNKKGGRYCKTRNIIKSEKQLLKMIHRLKNIRHNYLHQVTSEIINRKPKFVVLEDLNVKGMMKNQHLSKAIQEQCFYEFYRQMEYKCDWNGILFITADRYFASSKTCCCCGYVKKDLKLSDRIYVCPKCHNMIDRDYQASVNLMRYGLARIA